MASILGSCGCGCGGGCEPVTSNCNFFMRKYDLSSPPSVTWNSSATPEMIACFESNGQSVDCYQGSILMSFSSTFSPCTGEGEVYLNTGGGGGGAGCLLFTDLGPSVYSIPCGDGSTDLSNVLLYDFYDAGSGSGILFNGDITYNGVEYTVSAGVPALAGPPPDPNDPNDPNNSQQSAPTANLSASISTMSSGTLLGTFTSSYTDEYIDFDQIGEVELTELEKSQPNPPCKFSYNFRFTPDNNSQYYIMTQPCDDTQGYATVALEEDGRAYFNATYNKTTQTCFIVQSYAIATE